MSSIIVYEPLILDITYTPVKIVNTFFNNVQFI